MSIFQRPGSINHFHHTLPTRLDTYRLPYALQHFKMAAEARVAFPNAPEDFEKDDRVSFSKLDNKWILEDHDGSEWEYLEQLNKWVPSVR